MDQILDRPELNSLIDASDCYVSLHRSEGFGVTLAEAMALGKPVIATDYSANLDFMHAGNGLLVRYKLVRLDQDYGPYPKGSQWADPDVDHASQLMRFVYEHPDQAAEIGRQARRDIWRQLAPDAVGARIAQRLKIVAQRMEQPSAGLFR
jgi:glycosyltransferase involved in cell wall biosynthesis